MNKCRSGKKGLVSSGFICSTTLSLLAAGYVGRVVSDTSERLDAF